MSKSETTHHNQGIRTLKGIRSAIPIGGSCWIIQAHHHTREPFGIAELIRINASSFRFVDQHDEERLHLPIRIEEILKRPYGGVWKRRKDAQRYFKQLQKLWEDIPKLIDKLAQENEKKTIH